jgi:tRNA threonylcarbamoyladenosine biosynthesis protein TsaE
MSSLHTRRAEGSFHITLATRSCLARLAPFAIAVVASFAVGAAAAHPHVLIDATAEIVFDRGQLIAVRHVWRFDTTFTSIAIAGLDTNNDGQLSDAEFAPLASSYVEAFATVEFFTQLRADVVNNGFVPTEPRLELRDGRLTLFYTLWLAAPVMVTAAATLVVYDPQYFFAFTYGDNPPVTLVGAPAGCTVAYRPPQQLDPATSYLLSMVPPDQQALSTPLKEAVDALANQITVTCV